mgnify:CR=1 FL=1
MKIIKIDEYLVVNMYTHQHKFLASPPKKKSAYDVVIRIKGTVNIPDSLPTIDFGEINIPEIEEAMSNAEMK